MSALPRDPMFSQSNNKHDIPSFKRICIEFRVDSTTDFRFTQGQNNGLGYVYVIYDGESSWPFKKWIYPPVTLSNSSHQRFVTDKSLAGKGKGNILWFIRNEQRADKQFDWLVANKANRLSQAGISRLNQWIEAFVYCILGAQVNVQSRILAEGGQAKEAQSEFWRVVEGRHQAARPGQVWQRYQLAVDEAKVRLYLAVLPGAWLMPWRIVINTERVNWHLNCKGPQTNMLQNIAKLFFAWYDQLCRSQRV